MKNSPPLFSVKDSLGYLEYKIMKIIWDSKNRLTVRDILNLQKEGRPLAYTTLMTVVNHLYEKGFLSREKVKKTYYYLPVWEKNYIVGRSLSRLFVDLNKNYGKRKILYLALSNSIFPKISIEIPPYIIPFTYGASITAILFIFIFAAYSLIDNFIAIRDYLSIFVSNIRLLTDPPKLLLQAIVENIPLGYLAVTIVSIFLMIILLKRISKLFDIRLFVVE